MCTVIDIGGGSTEFIAGKAGTISKAKSIDIGAVRMTEKFFNPGIPVNDAVAAARDYIVKMIHDIVNDLKAMDSFILEGIGGTVTTLAAIDMELSIYDSARVHGYKLKKSSVDDIFKRLISMSLEERKTLKGLQPERADIIPAGTLILKTIMEELNSEYIVVSEYDNLEGLLMKYKDL
jgi:exopolyphosphatase/guanosine-5'-triphosphate,3'-diphosphate pyrophosphatase